MLTLELFKYIWCSSMSLHATQQTKQRDDDDSYAGGMNLMNNMKRCSLLDCTCRWRNWRWFSPTIKYWIYRFIIVRIFCFFFTREASSTPSLATWAYEEYKNKNALSSFVAYLVSYQSIGNISHRSLLPCHQCYLAWGEKITKGRNNMCQAMWCWTKENKDKRLSRENISTWKIINCSSMKINKYGTREA